LRFTLEGMWGEAMTIAANPPGLSDVSPGRLDGATLKANFADLHPALSPHEARVEAERCYFCWDPPCQKACPTSIDIPLFIRQIAAGNRSGAAKTIFDANIMGGMCARVCPTETLCEEACVREAAEGKPVSIGLLQRYATDPAIMGGKSPYERGAPTGNRVAIVGAGPAGLACAHALARAGVESTIFEAREKAGGLNEYGIAAYKTIDDFAAKEAAFILSIGGVEVRHGLALGSDVKLEDLRREYDAVFLAMGLGSTNKLGLPREAELENVVDAVDYIARLRQAKDLATLPVGRRVVVIGGGMTAIDIAVQSKKLGAQTVTIVYRRGPEQMKASRFERELAQTSGVVIRHWARPVSLEGHAGALSGVVFEDTHEREGVLASPGSVFRVEADMLFTAIGQRGTPEALGGAGIELREGRIVVDAERRASVDRVWAGGDCVFGGQDLTVSAVEDGKQAARSILSALGVAPQL
jgi:glutamate synthase (NADPH/NADH) small chain